MTLDARLTEAVRYIVDRSMLWAFVIVLVSACILGWSYQSGVSYLWAAIAVAVVLGEVGAIHRAVEAARDRDWIVMSAGVVIWAVCFAYSFVQSLGVAATSQDAGAAMRLAKHTIYEDATSDVSGLEGKLTALLEARSKMKPSRSAADARAELDKAEAHRFWQLTDACKSTKGPQTRTFCDIYRSAEADIRSWDAISVQDARIEEARKELRTAKGKRQAAPVSTASVDPFAQIANKYTGADLQTVSDIAAAQKTITVNSILTLTALMLFAGAAGSRRNRRGESEIAAPSREIAAAAPFASEPSTRIVERRTVETDGRLDRILNNLKTNGLIATR